MALGAADLADIEVLLNTGTEPAGVVGELRRRFPGMAVTTCDPSDVDLEIPFRTGRHFALHLVDSTNHCWRLTSDADCATGLMVVPQRVTA
jgi:hypothetical protein